MGARGGPGETWSVGEASFPQISPLRPMVGGGGGRLISPGNWARAADKRRPPPRSRWGPALGAGSKHIPAMTHAPRSMRRGGQGQSHGRVSCLATLDPPYEPPARWWKEAAALAKRLVSQPKHHCPVARREKAADTRSDAIFPDNATT